MSSVLDPRSEAVLPRIKPAQAVVIDAGAEPGLMDAVAHDDDPIGAPANPQMEFATSLPEDAEDHLVGQASPVPRCIRPAGTNPARVVWSYAIPIVVFHLLLPLAFVPYFFSWTGLLLVPIGNYVFCSLGIGAGFHRLLTHRSYKCHLWFEHLLAILGTCSLQQAPARWVMVHRMHHQHSDHEPDPHSPMVNWLWGHMGWVMFQNRDMQSMATYDRYAKDLLQDPFYMRLERNGLWFIVGVVHALLFFVAGYAAGSWMTGTSAGALRFGSSILL